MLAPELLRATCTTSGPAKLKHGAPFAQSENLVEADYPSSFHLQKHNTQVNDKVSCLSYIQHAATRVLLLIVPS